MELLLNFCVFMLVLFFVFLIFSLIARKYSNPYKLIMVFGKKGSGKSTLIAKLALRYLKQGKVVYSNIELNIPGIRVFDVQQIGCFVFPEESIVFIDEVGMIWDNRDYKNFRTEVRDYFKLQRHYRNTVYLFSQTFDIDVKLRNLTDHMFMVKNYANVLSVAHRVSRKLVVVEPTGDSEGRIADGYELLPLWMQIVGMRIAYVTFIPRWTKYFNSFEQADLPFVSYETMRAPLGVSGTRNVVSILINRIVSVFRKRKSADTNVDDAD